MIEFGECPEAARDMFYINLLSTNRMVYKGMLTVAPASQLLSRTSPIPNSSPRSLWFTAGSARTRFRAGDWASVPICRRTTARSTRSAAIATGCARERLRFAAMCSATSSEAVSDPDGARLRFRDARQALQFLAVNGRSLPHSVLMLIPEAWQNNRLMDPDLKAFYEYHACLMEPWDGPASIAFCNGE